MRPFLILGLFFFLSFFFVCACFLLCFVFHSRCCVDLIDLSKIITLMGTVIIIDNVKTEQLE